MSLSLKLKTKWSVFVYKRVPTICRKNLSLFIAIHLFILIFFCGCVQTPLAVTPEHQMTIACTIPPQGEFIRAIAGDEPVTILVMVPQGASPHTFEPTPSQIAGLESADLYMALGSGIEFENRWIDRIENLYPDLPVINTSEQVVLLPMIEHDHREEDQGEQMKASQEMENGHPDPHVWLSLKNTAVLVQATTDAMIEKWPEKRDIFIQNQDEYLLKLNSLDETIRASLRDIPSRTILVYHPAFGYFCSDYNLTQMAVEEDGREPSAQRMAEIVRTARNQNITFVFAEPESSTREAETLAREINGTMVLISPLAGDYLKNMDSIAEKISGS